MKRGLALFLSVAMLASSVSAARPAFADAFDAAMARAAAAKENALDANDPARWEEALRLFQEADALRASKESKYEIATAAAWLKQDDLACEAYEGALALGLEGSAKTKAETFVSEHAAKVARLKLRGPAGAKVIIEGRARGTLPRDGAFVIFAGGARVTVQHEGRSVDVDPNAAAGAVVELDVTEKLAPPPAKPVEKPSPVEPAKSPAQPVVDGAPSGTKSGVPTALVVAGGSVLVLSAVTWIYAATRVSKFDSDVAAYCGRPGWRYEGTYCAEAPAGTSSAEQSAAQSASDSAASWRAVRTGGIVGLAVGGAVAITGLVLVFGDKSESKSPVHAAASASPLGASFSLSGTF